MSNYIIYKHTNKLNGKSYIGLTSQQPETRWGKNGYGYYGQNFYTAILEFGWDNFEHEILETGLTKEEAFRKEKNYIHAYNTNSPYGYNGKLRPDWTAKPKDSPPTWTLSKELYESLSESADANYRTLKGELSAAIAFYLKYSSPTTIPQNLLTQTE